MSDEVDDSISFNDIVPLPYRVIFFIELAVLLWYSLTHYCYKYERMNVLSLLSLSYSPHNYSRLDGEHNYVPTGEHHATVPADPTENNVLMIGIKNTLKKITTFNLVSYLLYNIIKLSYFSVENAIGSIILTPVYYLLPIVTLAYNVQKLFVKSTKPNAYGQYRVFTTLKRILLGGINSQFMRTNDILFSDSLTSYAKVLNDIALFFWSALYSTSSPYSPKLELLVLAFPALVRMKQCFNEYQLTKQRQHAFNFIKYSTGLGPIFIKLLIKINLSYLNPEVNSEDELTQTQLLENLNRLNTWWYLASIVNSTYSFIWDIRMDWGFQLLEPIFNTHSKSITKYTALRPPDQLVYRNYVAYYSVIVIDFVLRFFWVLKLFVIKEPVSATELNTLNHLGHFFFGNDVYSFGYAMVEFLEIFRRWLWCFLKLESDWVKLQKSDTILNSSTSTNIEMASLDKRG